MTTWSYVNMLFIISNISMPLSCKCTKILRPVFLKIYDPDALHSNWQHGTTLVK